MLFKFKVLKKSLENNLLLGICILRFSNINTVSTNPWDVVLHHRLRLCCIQLHTLVVIPSMRERMPTSSYLVAFDHRDACIIVFSAITIDSLTLRSTH